MSKRARANAWSELVDFAHERNDVAEIESPRQQELEYSECLAPDTRVSARNMFEVWRQHLIMIRPTAQKEHSRLDVALKTSDILECFVIENLEPRGPPEPIRFRKLLSRLTHSEILNLVTRSFIQVASLHPRLRNLSEDRITLPIRQYCRSRDSSNLRIDDFAAELSETIAASLGVQESVSLVVFIESTLREAIGLDGRITKAGRTEREVLENSLFVVRAIYGTCLTS